jgi:hypothetical protein
MNQFPPAPLNRNPALNLFGRFQPQTGDQQQQRVRQIEAMMAGQGAAQSVGQGIGQMVGGMALGSAKRGAAFPGAPAGGQPSFMTGLMNFMTGGHNGGLF